MSEDHETETPRLHRVMVRCVESGEGVPTGVRIDPDSLRAGKLGEQTFKCPHCFHEHTWSSDDAWTEAGAC
jgi:hypothetical protein